MLNWFKPNDWYPIVIKTHIIKGKYRVIDGFTHGESKIRIPIDDDICTYEILYSKSRNEYKLECVGTNYQIHPEYAEVLTELNRLTNESKKY